MKSDTNEHLQKEADTGNNFNVPGICASLHPQYSFRESAWHSRRHFDTE